MKKTKGNKPSVLSENVSKLRNRLGMTQAAFAKSIGMSFRGYQDFEYGRIKTMPFESMEKLAELANVEIRSLNSADGPQPIKQNTPDQDKAELLIELFKALPALENDELRFILEDIRDLPRTRGLDTATLATSLGNKVITSDNKKKR